MVVVFVVVVVLSSSRHPRRQPERDGVRSVCYDIAHKPDGTQLVTGVGSRVLVYDCADGDLLHSLKGHKDAVYTVSYSCDGKRFASGAADKTIIIWTSKAEGILKYSHNDAIQCLAYNPVSQQLASATATDFGLWSPEQKKVAKHKVSYKVLTLAWSNDGQYLALGQYDGVVSVRDKGGGEKVQIQRNGPVWSLAWNPNPNETHDMMAVGCWDGTLSFYQLNGMQVGKDRALGYDPCSVSYFSNGEYMCLAGTDRKVTLATKEGTPLVKICDRSSWVWCAAPRPKQNYVAVGCEDGSISMHQLIFSTVHGLYQDRYAYRDYMTDVIIQHLITEQKVRIKCRDYVKKIAVYKDRLAVQLPDKVIIYELLNDDSYDMHYRVSTTIKKKLDCNLLVVTSHHVILCLEKKLQLYAFNGVMEREWVLEAVIRYIKIVGGPENREGILVGLKNGMILKIFIDNAFPIQLIKHSASIRCLDLSFSRNKLAVVDENAAVVVYDLNTKAMTYEDKNANSVAWNSEFEDMFCYSGNGQLSIKTGDFAVHQQKLQGFVVGFKGSKIFCLHYISMQTIDVPQSASLYRYVEQKNYDTAYKVACLGVTENDWRLLAMRALDGMSLNVARKSFIRIRDMRFIELLNRIEKGLKLGEPEHLFQAEVFAYQGKYQDAAKMYGKANRVEKAMEMFSDLRQFEEAKAWAEEYAQTNGGDSSIVQEFVQRQAEWAEEVADYESAATMYIQAKKYDKAIALLGKHDWRDKLVEVMRALDPEQHSKALQRCGEHFSRWGDHQHAKEVYNKLGDHAGLLALHVEAEKWDDAFALVRQHPQYGEKVYLPYARWLAVNDRFEEARAAYTSAGHSEMATQMLEQLTHNAVMERRFQDAGYCYWLLSQEVASELPKDPRALLSDTDEVKLHRFHDFKERSEIYYAYDYIYRAMDEPFRSSLPGMLLNIGQFLLAKYAVRKEWPFGISHAYVLNTLAKHGETLGAFRLARDAYNTLQGLRVPAAWQSQLDLACVVMRSKPNSDNNDLLALCYRCSTHNPFVSPARVHKDVEKFGDVCIGCGGGFVRSFVTFEPLPTVEFEVADGISASEARKLINEDPPTGRGAKSASSHRSRMENGDGFHERDMGGDVQTLMFDDGPGAGGGVEQDELMLRMDDPFTQQMAVPKAPIQCNREMLRNLNPSEVVIKPSGCALVKPRYFRLMDPECPITVDEAGNFYETDEYELACLERGRTPFTRKAVKRHGEQASAPPEPETPSTAEKKKTGWGAARGMSMVRGLDLSKQDYVPDTHTGAPRSSMGF